MDEVQNTGGVKVTETKHTRFGFKRLLNRRSEGKIPGRAIAILLLVVIILAGGIYGWRLRQESIATRNSICNGRDDNEFYKQLAINFHPNRYKELYANTLKINQTKGHEKDANCVYALFRYDIVSGDVSSARSSLALLKRVYEAVCQPD